MKIISILGQIFFPRRCLGCGISLKTGVVCRECFSGIPLRKTFFCGECGGELPIAMKLCHPRAPCLMGAAGTYGNPVLTALIHNLKFRNAREAAEPLAELMATFILANAPGRDYTLVPIPLSLERERERGYNQTVDIAAQLGLKLALPVAADLLVKTKNTKPQVATRDLEERRGNLAGCFAARDTAAAAGTGANVAGKKIMLIDDVTTSGTTFMEAAKVLKAAGAKRIIGIAAAKA